MCSVFGDKCAKTVLISINILWFMLGNVIVGTGIWMVVGKDSLLALIFPMPENSTDTIMQRSDNIGVRQLRTEQNEVENELSSYIAIASVSYTHLTLPTKREV